MSQISAPDEEPEMLDRPGLPVAEAERSLRELDQVNRWTLGSLPLSRTVLPRLGRWSRPRLALDLGTGSGEVAAGLARAAAKRGAPLKVVGLDLKLRNHLAGRRRGVAQLRVVADAEALPFRDGTFEWSFSTLFFHHFDGETNRRVLAEMRRVASAGAAVVDIRRNRIAPVLLDILFFFLRIGEVTRHDGRVSFRRSWSLREVRRLVAGLPVLEVRRRFPFRFSLVLRAGAPPAADQGLRAL
jgi:ubiquinone/menaquinone biosynthesis C-methylase UbiE